MTGYVVNLVSCEVIKEIRDQLVDVRINEDFLTDVLHCLRSTKFSPEGKTRFFELVVGRFEKEINILDI